MAKAEDLGIDDVEEVLTEIFSLEGDIAKGEFRTLCPVHEIGEAGHSPSVDVNLETGYWNCFSCPASGDLVDLGVVVLENLPFEWKTVKSKKGKTDNRRKNWNAGRARVHKVLKSDDPNAIAAAVKRRVRKAKRSIKEKASKKGEFVPIIPPVSAYKFYLPKYLKDRGFTKETLRKWNIRYAEEATLLKEDGKSFTLTHAVAIPIFDKENLLLGWCYRATYNSEEWFQHVRYIYTPGITDILNQMWFGMNLHQHEEEIAVTEGALDAIWCDQNGIPAVAVLGSQVKQTPKIRALMDFKKVTLFCDRDFSGATTAYYLGTSLQERGVPCTVCRYPSWMKNRRGEQAKDPQDLCELDIELVHLRAIPFTSWTRSNRAA